MNYNKEQVNKVQVKKGHYNFNNYIHKGRFVSYWHQIDEIIKTNPKTVLEIGIGNKFLYNFIKWNFRNIEIKGVDIDIGLNPDYVSSVSKIPVRDNSFDTVVCFQVLEHLPFEEFISALNELKRISRKNIIISLPDRSKSIGIQFFAYNIINISFKKILSIPVFSKKHKYDGEHYWEIGKKNFSLRRVKKIISECNLKIIETYRIFEKPLHRFFILSKG